MIKIGYQGIEYSNNYIAAEKFVELQQMEECVLIPLISSENVVYKLMNDEIDLGIMAIFNSTIGQIRETQKALSGKNLTEYARIEFTIKHAAFKLDKNLKNSDIKYVVSHEAALAQCQDNIKLTYPNAEFKTIENTALGPGMLVSGKISSLSVILCPPKAGEKYNLFMDSEDMSDKNNNVTTFGVFRTIK